jgi:hypothetical protein
MNIHKVPVSDVLCSVFSSPQGLSSTTAQARIAECGPNRVEPLPREHWLLNLLGEFTGLFSNVLWRVSKSRTLAAHL